NGGSAHESRTATLTATLDGVPIYSDSTPVSDVADDVATPFDFASFLPTQAGTLQWTVTIEDDDPDDDTAHATTQVTGRAR
ncbi:MAG: hypothetical protein ACYTG6_15760, partial [Planctomycetota bacterium]